MKIKKTTKALMLLSLVAIVFDLARGNLWDKMNLLYLIWNLFLAWIPYIISLYFIKKETPLKLFAPLFILWLLFFPNAPYLVTDVLHVAGRMPSLLWYDSLLFFFFGWLGLLLGMLSLLQIHTYLKNHLSALYSELIIFAICIVSSFGIYLGRFERWNSWDIFVNPMQLAQHSYNIGANLGHPGTPLAFIFAFTFFTYAIYKTVQVLIAPATI